MYLLIHTAEDTAVAIGLNLHSIMYLLIPDAICLQSQSILHLHSIMYLLILKLCIKAFNDSVTFTFHNVSINSHIAPEEIHTLHHLHSIMYLLIPVCKRCKNSFYDIYIP